MTPNSLTTKRILLGLVAVVLGWVSVVILTSYLSHRGRSEAATTVA